MDSVSSSSSDEECDSRPALVPDSQPPQLLPPPYCFLQPNSTALQPVFDDSIISRFLHQVSAAQPHLTVDESVYNLSNPTLVPHPDGLDAIMNSSPAARALLYADPSLLDRGGGLYQDPRPPQVVENTGQAVPAVDSVLTAQSAKGNKPAGRSRKKRTRASRRTPTTVMTTDTSNFRAMVQEFTGIPATSLLPSHLHRAGIGLLGPSRLGFGNKLDPQLPYGRLLRPFAHKMKPAAMFGDGPPLGQQLPLPSDHLGLLNFQSFAQLQATAGDLIGPVATGTAVECNDQATLDHLAPRVDFHDDPSRTR